MKINNINKNETDLKTVNSMRVLSHLFQYPQYPAQCLTYILSHNMEE